MKVAAPEAVRDNIPADQGPGLKDAINLAT